MKLPKYDSCTYRVHTTCGMPKVSWFASETTLDEYDIAYSTVDGLMMNETDLFNINATSPQGGNMYLKYQYNANLTMLDNSIEQKYNESEKLKKLNFFGTFYGCTGMDRNMYLTITRVKEGSTIEKKSELLAEARVMQAASKADYVSLVFTNTPGSVFIDSGAQALAATFFAVIMLSLATLF